MKTLTWQNLFSIALSIFIALVLLLIPPPSWALWFKPPWVEMIVFFWVLYLPQQFNLITAWFIGLFIDVLTNAPLGEHAATLITATYLVRKFYQQLRMFPLWQQSCVISIVLLIHQLLLFWIQHLIGQHPVWIIWIPPLMSLFLWPLMVTFLKSSFRKILLATSF